MSPQYLQLADLEMVLSVAGILLLTNGILFRFKGESHQNNLILALSLVFSFGASCMLLPAFLLEIQLIERSWFLAGVLAVGGGVGVLFMISAGKLICPDY